MENILYYLNLLAEKLGKLLLFASAAASCYFFFKAFAAKTPFAGLSYLLLGGLPLAIFTGGLFVRIYLPGIVEKLTFGIFGGRSYLTEAPPVLSPLWGDLKTGAYSSAFEKAEELLNAHPFHGEILYIYCMAAFQLPEEGLSAILQLERYFLTCNKRDPSWQLKLLFLYADEAAAYRSPEEILAVLKQEQEKNFYLGPEKNAISQRITTFGS